MRILLLLVSVPVFANVFCAKYSQSGERRNFIHSGWVNRQVQAQALSEQRGPRYFVEHEAVTDELLVELCSQSQNTVEQALHLRNVYVPQTGGDEDANDEVFTLIENGPSNNRIDLVFMGDGYTLAEKEKFLADMKRLTAELFEGKTFASYRPIFNVYAVFRPSVESGIGKNDTPKNTAYRLYRLGNTLRAIYVGNAEAAHSSCSKAPGCDYPILIANDPYYGGLGGEFSVSTSSPTSGMVVLRHELGHSVGNVGEEYDGGGYFGANHAYSLSSLGWRHWLTGEAKAEPAVAREVSWPWVNLSGGPFSVFFSSDGLWHLVDVQLSVSGLQTDNDIRVSLDGQSLALKGLGHADRDFHSFMVPRGLSSGGHELRFEEGVHDGDNWVSNLTIHEYRQDYHLDPNYIGAYPLFAGTRSNGFRPTHDTCLMRNMKSEHFCRVCQENNWLRFFRSIGMIDGVYVKPTDKGVSVRVKTQALGQFRPQAVSGERVRIRWTRNQTQLPQYQDLSEILVDDTSGQWRVEVSYETPEVREDPTGLLTTMKNIVF